MGARLTESAAAKRGATDRRGANDATQERIHAAWGWRSRVVIVLVLVGLGVVAIGAFRLQAFSHTELTARGDRQYIFQQEYRLPRRKIVDRNGAPLAVSAPRPTVIADPVAIVRGGYSLNEVADVLADVFGVGRREMQARMDKFQSRRYMIVKRHALPAEVERIRRLDVPGLLVERTYRRYYPTGEVAAALLGFTDYKENGQEGLERSFDSALQVTDHSQQVRRSRDGAVLEILGNNDSEEEQQALQLTIDRGLQYIAYRELKRAVDQHSAKSGAVVILEIATGDVLAMASYPSFNPHVRESLDWGDVINRAVVSVFEPGSTVKPLVIAAALQQGSINMDTIVDTNPGRFRVNGDFSVRDGGRNHGALSLENVLRVSSNIGAAKIGFAQGREGLWMFYSRLGFGMSTSSGLPNEAHGTLSHYTNWGPVEHATMSYGYGLSVTPLQLASAYATLGSGGLRRIPSVIRYQAAPVEERIFDEVVAKQVLQMLETVTGPKGTAPLAAIPGYRVAGKTGTARISSKSGGYTDDQYMTAFAGVVPASNPRFSAVVMIENPRGEDYYGGNVAAPVFSSMMGEALRLWSVEPDADKPREVVTPQVIEARVPVEGANG